MRFFIQVLFLCAFYCLTFSANIHAANRVYYENFDDKVVDSPISVSNSGYTWATGRSGSGYSFYLRESDEPDTTMCVYPGNWPTGEVYISYWMRYPTYNPSPDGKIDNMKILYMHLGSSANQNYSATDMYRSDYLHTSANSVSKYLGVSDYGPDRSLVDGAWHRYEWYFNLSTETIKVWVNGSKRLDKTYNTGSWPTDKIYRICAPSIDAGMTNSFSRQIDDWEVWDGMASGSTSSTSSTSATAPPPPGKPYVLD